MVRFTLVFLSLILIINYSKAQNVGIGEPAPATKFEIKGDSGTDLFNVKDQANDTKLFIRGNGNVGIGTPSPAYLLHVNGDNAQQMISSDISGGTAQLSISAQNAADTRAWHFIHHHHGHSNSYDLLLGFGTISSSHDNADLRFKTRMDEADKMIIKNDGNIGIGETNPSEKLEITGGDHPAILISNNSSGRDLYLGGGSQSNLSTTEATVGVTNGNLHIDSENSSKIYFQHYAQTDVVFNANGGNVGIGVSNPSTRLHVAGNMRLQNGTAINEFSTDGTLGGNSDDALPTEQAVKTYVDNINNWTEDGNDIYNSNSGNVGINTSNPRATLDVEGFLTQKIGFQSVSDQVWLLVENNQGTNNDLMGRLYIERSSGYNKAAIIDILVSTAGSSTKRGGYITTQQVDESEERYSLVTLDYNGNSYIALRYEGNQYMGTNAYFNGYIRSNVGNELLNMETSQVSNVSAFNSSGSENKHTIMADRVGINTNTPSNTYTLHVNGRIGSAGINETSDERLKKDIQPLEKAMDIVNELEGVSYHWRVDEFPDKNLSDRKEIGVIAQQVEKVLPEVVDTDDEGYKSVQYSHLVPVLIEALKEQDRLLSEKVNELNEVNQSIDDLKSEMSEIRQILEMNAQK